MLSLESQVCALEYAKRLKELNVKQDSLFYFVKAESIGDYVFEHPVYMIAHLSQCNAIGEDFISAFTVAELLSFLPNRITIKENEPFNSFRLRIEKSFYCEQDDVNKNIIYKEDIYICNYYCDSTECEGENAWMQRALTKSMSDSNCANALTKMLIYLIENNLV